MGGEQPRRLCGAGARYILIDGGEVNLTFRSYDDAFGKGFSLHWEGRLYKQRLVKECILLNMHYMLVHLVLKTRKIVTLLGVQEMICYFTYCTTNEFD